MDLSTFELVAGIGTALVVVGVSSESIEVLEKLAKTKSFRGWLKREGSPRWLFSLLRTVRYIRPIALWIEGIGLGIVIAGLAVEWYGSSGADRIRSQENAQLNHDAAALRLKADELEKQLQPRMITTVQMDAFKNFMVLVCKKTPIRISIGQEGFDTETFGKQMRDMFSYAGFSQTPDCGAWGLFRDNTRLQALPNFVTNDFPWVEIVFWSTNLAAEDAKKGKPIPINVPCMLFPTSTTNFEKLPYVMPNDSQETLFNAISLGFDEIKIPVVWIPENDWVHSNQFEIFIPLKP